MEKGPFFTSIPMSIDIKSVFSLALYSSSKTTPKLPCKSTLQYALRSGLKLAPKSPYRSEVVFRFSMFISTVIPHYPILMAIDMVNKDLESYTTAPLVI